MHLLRYLFLDVVYGCHGHIVTYIKVLALSIDYREAAQLCVGFRISSGLLICILLSPCIVATVQRAFPGVPLLGCQAS